MAEPPTATAAAERLATVDARLLALRERLSSEDGPASGSGNCTGVYAEGNPLTTANGSVRCSDPRDVVLTIYAENHRRRAESTQPFQLPPNAPPQVPVPPMDAAREARVRAMVLETRAAEERHAAQLRQPVPPPKRRLLAPPFSHIRSPSLPPLPMGTSPDHDATSSEAPESAAEGEGQLEVVLRHLADGLINLADVPPALAEWLTSAGEAVSSPDGAPSGPPLEPSVWVTLREILADQADHSTAAAAAAAPEVVRVAPRTRSRSQREEMLEPLLSGRPVPPDWGRVGAVPPPILTPEERRRTAFVSRNGWCPTEAVMRDIAHQRADETAWTPLECKVFLTKFRQLGKYFRGIADHLPRKDTSDVVAHYYRIKHQDPMPALRREVKQRTQPPVPRKTERHPSGARPSGPTHRLAQRVTARDGLVAFLGDGTGDEMDPQALQQLQLELQLDLQNRPRTRKQSAAVK